MVKLTLAQILEQERKSIYKSIKKNNEEELKNKDNLEKKRGRPKKDVDKQYMS